MSLRGAYGPSMGLLLGLILLMTALAAGAGAAETARTFYVGAGGDDSNVGTSPAEAWRTIDKVNSLDLDPGDRVLFEGGGSFAGTVRLGAEDAGTAGSPVVVGSYGEGRAVVSAGLGKGVSVYNAGGVEVRDLNVVGAGRANGNRENGVEFYTDRGGAAKLVHVRVEGVEASGFGGSGILLGAWPADGTKSGYQDVRISAVSAHDNADAGIQSYGYYDPSSTGWAHEDVYVGFSRAYANRGIPGKGNNSGSGIVLSDVDRGTIERSVAHGNGELNDHQGGGPVGIWAWESNAVVIQHNESYGNKTRTIDGGGFDLDGGVTNSVMQYNYSHDNAGAGYLLYQFPGAGPFGNNVVRYNVSENDGRTNLGGISAGGGATTTTVHNNTVYASPRPGGGLPPALRLIGDGTTGFRFLDNALVTTGGAPLVEASGNHEGVLFRGNAYWSSGSAFDVRYGGSAYRSLDAWRASTGQERDGTAETGLTSDPRLVGPGTGGTIGSADRLSSLEAYGLLPDSPLIDAGQGARSLGLDTGPLDFYGTSLPRGGGHDVGAQEFVPPPSGSEPAPPPAPAPNAAPTITKLRPSPGSSTRDRTPTISALARDAETNLLKGNLLLYVDERRVTSFSYDASGDVLRYTPRLAPGPHGVKVTARDAQGLVRTATWKFRVTR